jgi:hypothetical protein
VKSRTFAESVDFAKLRAIELLALHARVSDELRARGLTRTSNSPTGDLAEYIFCKAFGWKRADNSSRDIDAVDAEGTKYQIKGRRLTRFNQSRQLSQIRDLKDGHFDYLAGTLFTEDYSILRAAIIPHAVALQRASFVERTNSYKFILQDDVWDAPGVRDVTPELRAVSL